MARLSWMCWVWSRFRSSVPSEKLFAHLGAPLEEGSLKGTKGRGHSWRPEFERDYPCPGQAEERRDERNQARRADSGEILRGSVVPVSRDASG
ncbi:hypothetical protein BV20DRAFT_685150 [Pilatotrama ljubarskyi]|nr:hypothetical protein BV20DRAFT_685150 [Pilatotrama ljubarskyi]